MSQFGEMKSGAEMRDHILGKAAEDAEFRTRLIADPKAALNEELGMKLPDGFAISVHEDSSTHVNLVLPPTDGLDPAALEQARAAHGGSTNCYAPAGQDGGMCWT